MYVPSCVVAADDNDDLVVVSDATAKISELNDRNSRATTTDIEQGTYVHRWMDTCH